MMVVLLLPLEELLLLEGELQVASHVTPAEDDEDEAAEQEDGLQDCHTLLEYDLIGQDAEAGAQSEDLALGLLTLGLEGDDGGLPDLVVLGAHAAELGQHGVIEGAEEGVDAADLALLHLLEGLLEEARLVFDVL